jgi:ABC-type phosphate transport system substrate-binding protein
VTRHRTTTVLGASVIAMLAAGGEAAGFKVVVHSSVPVATLSRAAVSNAFLKRTEKWPDGSSIVPVDQAHDSPVRQAFSKEILERSVAMVDAFWQRQVFSGHGTPPLTRATDAEVVAYVRSVPGAIGYVSAGADTTGVREIRVE